MATIQPPIPWKEIRDSYDGLGGYVDGTYLVAHSRENTEGIARRKQLCFYRNYVQPIVNSHVAPIFKRGVTRDWDPKGVDGDLISQFVEDVDRSGHGMGDFVKIAMLNAKLYGCCFIVVDNVAQPEQNLQAVKEKRAQPYVYSVLPEQIKNYAFDNYGNLLMIEWTAVDGYTEDGAIRKVDKRWDNKSWVVKELDGKVISSGDHNLGRCPVVMVACNSPVLTTSDYIPSPPFVSVMRCARSIFNKDSWKDEILANQTFNILLIPSGNPSSIELGTNNALGFEPGEKGLLPQYIAPNSDPARILIDEINVLVQEMYRMAMLSHVTGVTSTSSGVAKAWENEELSNALAGGAAACEVAERQIMDIYGLWTNLKDKINYRVAYSREYSIMDVASELDNALKALDLPITSPTLKVETTKRMVSAYLPNLKDDVYDKIAKEVEDNAVANVIDQQNTPLVDGAPGEVPPKKVE